MKYSKEQISILRQTPMRDILAAEGFDTSHTSGGLFFSPFREKERTPSFHIDDIHHQWYDHGDPTSGLDGRRGGDTVSFVRKLKCLSFPDALDYLCRYNPSVVPDIHVDAISVPRYADRIVGGGPSGNRRVKTIVTDVLGRFLDWNLICYAAGRGITEKVLNGTCNEVHYKVVVINEDSGEIKDYSHNAIGFRNVDGGWTLRYNPRRAGDKGKRSTGGGFSAITPDGGNLSIGHLSPQSGSVVVFEGFMDYMSWLVLYRESGLPDDTDIVVLNSVANTKAALPFILEHANVVTVLDADDAGTAATEVVRQACREHRNEGIRHRFYDARDVMLCGYKDMNERLQGERAARMP